MTIADLRELGLPPIDRLKLADLLAKRYPEHSWQDIYLMRGKYSQQRRLEKAVSSIFEVSVHMFSFTLLIESKYQQGKEISINARKAVGLIKPDTGVHMELDIFIPSLNLGFEFQV